ncbi:TfoX-like protein [Alteromonadaceae bacterium 2753L.S.0a.02]|nr:TfoX-like protein [Alteromonadaceae bacterium 2753L.S.0a.02]
MAYNEALAQRIRLLLGERNDVVEKKMFGGLAFMVAGHMCVGVSENRLMARVGPDNYQAALEKPHAHEMDFTGKPMKGFVFVEEPAISDTQLLREWIALCESFVFSLPPK